MSVWKKTLVVAILFACISLLYQAVSFAGSNRYQIQALRDVVDSGPTPPLELQLRMAYPYRVRFEGSGDLGRPISVWLVPQPATFVSSPVTYTVRFEPSDNGLLFTDKEGNSTSPQVEMVVGSSVETPGLVYLHPAPLKDNMPSLVQLKVIIEGPPPSKVSLNEPLSLMVRVEKHWVAGLRRFLDLLLGPTTFLLALAGGLISWGLQQQARESDRKRREQIEISIKIGEIQRIAETGDQGEAIYQWWKYDRQTKTDPDWQKPELRAALEDVWQKIGTDSWQLAVLGGAVRHLGSNEREAREMAKLTHDLDPDSYSPAALAATLLSACLDESQEAVNSALEIGPKNAIDSLLWLYQRFGEAVRPLVVPILAGLAGRPESIPDLYVSLVDDVDG
ncbi:MAG: hypothetical protein Kow0063_18670 [Anaerolineae bacterium]